MPITTALAVSFSALALVALVQQIQIRQLQRQIREGFQLTEDALNKGKTAPDCHQEAAH
ncbi:hypothetical protein [Faecalispora jeddahensis]|uniref:hypothetical protein n=1 Tax=Faecalispora jeddahensis TaxID=1414721 RepID=UPI001896FF88|nr:hypothetical protein [Faecalispora jeddahensis]